MSTNDARFEPDDGEELERRLTRPPSTRTRTPTIPW